MSKFLETYGVAIFTLVLVAILIAFAGPLGMKIKNATTNKVCQIEQIGKDEIRNSLRPEEPKEAVDEVWWYIDKNNEIVISQEKITAPSDAIVSETKTAKPFENYDPTDVKTVRFEGAIKPKDCQFWFWNCLNLTEIKNIENLYTNECRDMTSMFFQCRKLTNVDVSCFDTSNVTNMSHMFYDCESLVNLDINGWNTSKVTDMSNMFYDCKSLSNLDVSNFDTSSVTDMSMMFYNCKNINELNCSSFICENVTYTTGMFSCCGIKSLDLSNFNPKNLQNSNQMFAYSPFRDVDISKLNLSHIQGGNCSGMFKSCSNITIKTLSATKDIIMSTPDNSGITGPDRSKPNKVTWILVDTGEVIDPITEVWCYVDKNGELVISQNKIVAPKDALEKETETQRPGGVGASIWMGNTTVKTVRFEGNVKTNNCKDWFSSCRTLTEIKNLENLDVSDCTDFTNMFFGCTSLTSLNLSAWNIKKNPTVVYMFRNCASLSDKSVKVSQATYDKLMTEPNLGITADKFDIVK